MKVCWNMYVLVYLFRMLFCVYEKDKSILFKNILASPRSPYNIPGYVYFHYTILFPYKISEILLINKNNFAIVMPFLIQLSYLHFLFSLYIILYVSCIYTVYILRLHFDSEDLCPSNLLKTSLRFPIGVISQRQILSARFDRWFEKAVETFTSLVLFKNFYGIWMIRRSYSVLLSRVSMNTLYQVVYRVSTKWTTDRLRVDSWH